MATIPNQATGLRHVRKTITFDGSANNGNLGDAVPVFTTTGRVRIEDLTIFCSDSLVCSAGGDTSLKPFLDGASWGSAEFFVNSAATGTWADDNTTGFKDAYGIAMPSRVPAATDGNVTLSVNDAGAGADITAGTLIIDCWYRPITDDGALAGDDIDTELVAAVNAQVVDALATDTYAEPGSVPAATSSLKDKINWLFALARNKVTQTSTTQTLRNDADSGNIATSSVSDDGSTFTRGEWS